ncbi:MAG: argininosuccinate lyase, partial [Actinomycetota bacterium]
RLTGLLAVGKTPSARSDALIFLYGETPRALDVAARATRLMRGVVATLEVNAERMAAALLDGFSQATDLAEYVMQECRIDYRTAYHVVGDTVRRASRDGLRGVDITAHMLDDAAKERLGHGLGLSDDDLAAVLDPEAIVRSRTVDGGAAPETVRAMAGRCAGEADRIADEAARAAASYQRVENALVDAAERVSRG